jgi:hypothetical protein
MEKNEVYLRIFKGIKKMGGRNTELVCWKRYEWKYKL